MGFSLPIRSRPSAAEASSAPKGLDTNLVQLPVRNESTIRTLDDMTVSVRIVNPKPKVHGMTNKKNVSAAAMLKKHGKVAKSQPPQNKKASKKARISSESLSHRAKAAAAATRERIREDTEREILDVFNTLIHSLTVNGDNDTTFVNSVNDATRILTSPLEDEQVESIHARKMAHVTRAVVMRERVRIYEEHMKAKEETLNGYFNQMGELEHDMKKLGSHVMGPDVAQAGNKIEIVMNDTFIEQMKRATRDDYRALDNWTYKLQEMDDTLMADLHETEMEFERDVRNLKANLFESII